MNPSSNSNSKNQSNTAGGGIPQQLVSISEVARSATPLPPTAGPHLTTPPPNNTPTPLNNNKSITRIQNLRLPNAPVPTISDGGGGGSCWQREACKETVEISPLDGQFHPKAYYECSHSINGCEAQKVVHKLPHGDAVNYLLAHNHPPRHSSIHF